MKVNMCTIRRYVYYSIKSGLKVNYKKYLFFCAMISVLFLFLNVKASTNTLISDNSIIGFWDYILYLFMGKEKIVYMSKVDVFEIPFEWMLVHGYILISVGVYPKEEYNERGYQFLIRMGNKFYWWFGKTLYIAVSVLIYYIGIIVVSGAFAFVKGGSFYCINKNISEFILGIDSSFINVKDIFIGGILVPLVVLIVLCITEMSISFLLNSIASIIIMLSYIGISVYWCNKWLIGSYNMILRKIDLSYRFGIMISIVYGVIFFIVGYRHFKKLDLLSKRRDEL